MTLNDRTFIDPPVSYASGPGESPPKSSPNLTVPLRKLLLSVGVLRSFAAFFPVVHSYDPGPGDDAASRAPPLSLNRASPPSVPRVVPFLSHFAFITTSYAPGGGA